MKVQSVKYLAAQLFITVSNCSRNKSFYGGWVVEKNEMHVDVPVSDMRYAFRAS